MLSAMSFPSAQTNSVKHECSAFILQRVVSTSTCAATPPVRAHNITLCFLRHNTVRASRCTAAQLSTAPVTTTRTPVYTPDFINAQCMHTQHTTSGELKTLSSLEYYHPPACSSTTQIANARDTSLEQKTGPPSSLQPIIHTQRTTAHKGDGCRWDCGTRCAHKTTCLVGVALLVHALGSGSILALWGVLAKLCLAVGLSAAQESLLCCSAVSVASLPGLENSVLHTQHTSQNQNMT